MRSLDIKCSVCGNYCNLWLKSFRDYVYKISVDHKYYVQCSYKCWREQGRRFDEIWKKEEK